MRPAPLLMTTPPRVERLHIGKDRRIVCISDIHGNLDYLKGLLAKCALTDRDVLMLVGDLLEKGPDSLAELLRPAGGHRAERLLSAVSGGAQQGLGRRAHRPDAP